MALVLLSDPARFSSFFVRALLSTIARSKAFRAIPVLGLFRSFFLRLKPLRWDFWIGRTPEKNFGFFRCLARVSEESYIQIASQAE